MMAALASKLTTRAQLQRYQALCVSAFDLGFPTLVLEYAEPLAADEMTRQFSAAYKAAAFVKLGRAQDAVRIVGPDCAPIRAQFSSHDSTLIRAAMALQSGNEAEALNLTVQGTSYDPGRHEPIRMRARVLATVRDPRIHDSKLAQECIESIFQKDEPATDEDWKTRAIVRAATGESKAAQRAADHALRLHRQEYWLSEDESLFSYELEPIRSAKPIVPVQPADELELVRTELLGMPAEWPLESGNARTISLATRLIILSKDDEVKAYGFARRGYAKARLLKLDEAEKDLQAAVQLAPRIASYRVRLAMIRDERGRDVVDECREALMIDPNNSVASALMGWSLIRRSTRRPESEGVRAGLQALERALADDPRSDRALYYRGRAYLAIGRNEDALRDLVECVKQNRVPRVANFERVYEMRAEAALRTGNSHLALCDAALFLALKPKSREAVELVARAYDLQKKPWLASIWRRYRDSIM